MTAVAGAGRRRVYLMRHADVSYFRAGSSPVHPAEVVLTGRGREQARAAGRALRSVRFDRVVTSGLPRTRETARLVLEQLDTAYDGPVLEDRDLVELRSGSLDDVPADDLEHAFLGAFRAEAARETAVLGGETVGSLIDRVLPAFERLCADEWQTLLLIAHGGVNRALLSWAIAGEPRFFGHLEQSACCINILDEGPGWLVRAVNLAPYDLAHEAGRTTTMEETLAHYRAYRETA